MSRVSIAVAAAAAILGGLGVVLFTAGPLKDSDPPKPLPEHEYVEKADEVCHDIEIEQAKLDNTIFKDIPFDESPPPELYVKYVKALIPTYTDQMAKLRKIAPPKDRRENLKRYFAATERVVALLREIAADPAKVSLLSEKSALFDQADEAAESLDLKACAHAED
jgi:hypothetical protein